MASLTGLIGIPHLAVLKLLRTVVLRDFASFFNPENRIKEVKYENVLWKILCAIGIIVEKIGLKIRGDKNLKLKYTKVYAKQHKL